MTTFSITTTMAVLCLEAVYYCYVSSFVRAGPEALFIELNNCIHDLYCQFFIFILMKWG